MMRLDLQQRARGPHTVMMMTAAAAAATTTMMIDISYIIE